jgi:4-amino-4-deoxy-L-arabinose transferase-like glycosyltransferase
MLRKNFLLILILLLAIFLRFFKLDYLELFGDEIDAGYQSYSLLNTARDYRGHFLPLYAQSFSEWRAPMMMYFMIPFIKVFGLNEWGVRTFAAFFGVISILGMYYFLLEIGLKKKIALVSIFLVSILPWHIQYSRSGFEITLMSSLILWGLLFFVKFLEKRKVFFLITAAITLSLSFYTYNTSNIYVPLLLLLVFISKRLVGNKKIIKPFIFLLAVMFILSLPILNQIFFGKASERFQKVSLFNNEQQISEINEYRTRNNNSLISKVFYNKYVYSVKKISANYLNAFSSDFLFGMGDVTFRHSLHKVGNLFWIYGIVIIIGLVSYFRKKDKKFADYFMFGFLLLSPIPSSLTMDGSNHATRLFLMIFPLCYFAANGIIEIFKFKKIIGLVIVLGILFEFSYFQYYYWNSYKVDSWRWWHYGYKEAMQKIVGISNKYDKVLIENTYEPALIRFLFWSQYEPKKVFGIKDNVYEKINNFEGYCIDSKICFANFGNEIFNVKKMEKNNLYMINQSINVGGDWDWSKEAPEGINVVDTIRNPKDEPLFYLVSKK